MFVCLFLTSFYLLRGNTCPRFFYAFLSHFPCFRFFEIIPAFLMCFFLKIRHLTVRRVLVLIQVRGIFHPSKIAIWFLDVCLSLIQVEEKNGLTISSMSTVRAYLYKCALKLHFRFLLLVVAIVAQAKPKVNAKKFLLLFSLLLDLSNNFFCASLTFGIHFNAYMVCLLCLCAVATAQKAK